MAGWLDGWMDDGYTGRPIRVAVKNKGKAKKKTRGIPPEVFKAVLGWMCQNRLETHISKYGIEFVKDISKEYENIKLLNNDVIEDVKENYPEYNENMLKSLWNPLTAKAKQLIRNFWKEFPDTHVNLIDKETQAFGNMIEKMKIRLNKIQTRMDSIKC